MRGLFRWKAVVPGLVTLGVVVVFAVFFLDWTLEWGIEKAGTKVNGARVELGGVDISWRNASITLRGLAVTDRAAPMTNLVEVGNMTFELAPKPLAWFKFIIEKGEITGIRTGTARSRSGAIAAVEEQVAEGDKKKEPAKPAAKPALPTAEVKAKFDPDKVKAEDLNSYQLVMKEKARIASASDAWGKTADSINVDGKAAEAKAFIDRVRGTAYSGAEGAKKAAEDLKEAQRLQRELKQLQEQVAAAKRSVEAETAEARSVVARVNEQKKKDVDALLASYGISSLSTEGLTRAVIGEAWFARVESGLHWFRKIRGMMPPKGKKVPPPPTRSGRDIAFKFQYAWPMFHLKKAKISGTTEGGIEYKGELRDVTSDPVLVGRPMVLLVDGKGKGKSLHVKAVLDYTESVARESVEFRFTGLDLAGVKLGDAGGPVAIRSGKGTLSGALGARGEAITGKINLDAAPATLSHEMDEKAKSQKMMQVVHKTLVGLKRLEVTILVGGRLTAPSFGLKSSMDAAFRSAIGSMMKGETEAARRKAQARVDALVDGEKGKLVSTITDKGGAAVAKLGGKASSVSSAQGQIDKVIEDLKKKSTASATGAATGAASGALKGLKRK